MTSSAASLINTPQLNTPQLNAPGIMTPSMSYAANNYPRVSKEQIKTDDNSILSRQYRTQAEMLDSVFDAKLLRFHRRHTEMERLIATFDERL